MTAEPGRALVVAYALVALAVFLDNGAIGPVSLPLVIAACVLVAGALAGWRARWPRVGVGEIVAAVLVVDAALVWVKPPAVYAHDSLFVARVLVTASALAAALLARRDRRVPAAIVLAAIVAAAAVAGVAILRASPDPVIDVFTIQSEGARDLWNGFDPYTASFTNPYTPEQTMAFFGAPLDHITSYPYPPATLFSTALAWRVAGDVRFAQLAAQLATAVAMYALARRSGARGGLAVGFAALVLVHPRGLFVLEQAWTEPLFALGVVATLALLDARGAARAALVLALGFLFAVKQYSVVFLPLAWSSRFGAASRATVVAALAVAAALTLPLAVVDPREFWNDVVAFQLHQPFRMDSLSIAPVIAYVTGWHAIVLGPIACIAAYVWGWRVAPGGRHGFALVAAAALLALFATAKQAFCNYYYFVGIVVLCAAVTAPLARADERPR